MGVGCGIGVGGGGGVRDSWAFPEGATDSTTINANAVAPKEPRAIRLVLKSIIRPPFSTIVMTSAEDSRMPLR